MRSILAAVTISIGLLAAPALVHAQTPDKGTSITLEGLSPEQMKILAGKAAELKEQTIRDAKAAADREAAKATPPQKAVDISEKARHEFVQWSDLGTGIGRAVLATAKEIGMAAADFAHSGLGKLVIALIIFKLFGSKLLGISFAITAMCVLIPMGMRFIKPVAQVEYEMVPFLWGAVKYRRVVKRTIAPIKGDEITGRWFGGMAMIGISLIIGAICVFNT